MTFQLVVPHYTSIHKTAAIQQVEAGEPWSSTAGQGEVYYLALRTAAKHVTVPVSGIMPLLHNGGNAMLSTPAVLFTLIFCAFSYF